MTVNHRFGSNTTMRIDLETDELSEADAFALAVLIHQQFPTVLGRLAFMTGAAAAAIISRSEPAFQPESPSAEEAFAGDGAPTSVAPSAEEAFAGPQSVMADASAPSVPAAQDVATPPASSSVGHVDLDADGLPWDARINAGGQAKNADGRWKKKRGVGADKVAEVQAELRATLNVPLASTTVAAAPSAPPPAAPTSTIPSTGQTGAAAAPPAAVTAPPPPAAPVASAPPIPPAPAPATSTIAPPSSAPPVTSFPPETARAAEAAVLAETVAPKPAGGAVAFTDVMRKVVEYTQAQKITAEDLNAICASLGIASPRDLLAQPALAPTFLDTLDAFVQSKG